MDDILILTRSLATTVPHILNVIDSFSDVSGYKINWGWQFAWRPCKILTYLGIKLTPQLEGIMTNNLIPLIEKIEPILQNWTKLGLSLLGKINILKMVIVPKINYVSYMLPLSLPRNALLKYNKVVYNFLWGGKAPYINRTKLYAAIEDGGLDLYIDWYHYAFCLKPPSKIYITAGQAPMWVSIERDLVNPHPIHAFITQTNGVTPYNNPVLTFSQETWRTSHKITGSNPTFTRKTSLWHNSNLKIGKKTIYWSGWLKLGIVYIGDLFEEDQFMSFEQLRKKHRLPGRDFWKYLQLRSCILLTRLKGPMSWPFPLIIMTLVRYTKIDLYCAIFQTHIGFAYSISVKYVYSAVFTLSTKRLVGALAPPPCEPSVLRLVSSATLF